MTYISHGVVCVQCNISAHKVGTPILILAKLKVGGKKYNYGLGLTAVQVDTYIPLHHETAEISSL